MLSCLLRQPSPTYDKGRPTAPTHLYSDEASWAAMGTSLAKMSGPVTAGSVGFTGKGFTRGAPRSREQQWKSGKYL